MINLPEAVCQSFCKRNPALNQIYITHIGYFPHAKSHYIQRRHGCADNILIYCERGKGWCRMGHYHFEILPNQYIIIPATSGLLTYGADKEDPWSIHWVHFTGPGLLAFNHALGLFEHQGPNDIPLNKTGLSIWEEIYTCLNRGFSIDNLRRANMCLSHFIATFLYPIPRSSQKDDASYIEISIKFMQSRLDEKITVEMMAEKLSLSASYFSTLFRKSTGMPPMDYFIHLKIQKACQLLYLGNMKVKDVATAIGYDDPFHFSRLFKKHMKISPLLYKETRREKAH